MEVMHRLMNDIHYMASLREKFLNSTSIVEDGDKDKNVNRHNMKFDHTKS